MRNRFCHFFDQKVRNDAGVKRAGADQNQIGFTDRVQYLWQRAHAAGHQAHAADAPARLRDLCFTTNNTSVLKLCFERNVLRRRRKDASANRKYLTREPHGFWKISSDVGERC